MLEKINGMPEAYAKVEGADEFPDVHGTIYFFDVHGGTIVMAELYGLPDTRKEPNGNFYGFHIHEGGSCTGDAADPFKDVGSHYNPSNVQHPKHAGDLPPVLNSSGLAWQITYTDRFHPDDIIGKTVVLHEMADDFKSQPSGDAGEKMACGEIKEWKL